MNRQRRESIIIIIIIIKGAGHVRTSGEAPRLRVLAKLAPLAQIGELARRQGWTWIET